MMKRVADVVAVLLFVAAAGLLSLSAGLLVAGVGVAILADSWSEKKPG